MLCVKLNKNTSAVLQRKNVTGNIICIQGLGVKILDNFWDLVITEILLLFTTLTTGCPKKGNRFYQG